MHLGRAKAWTTKLTKDTKTGSPGGRLRRRGGVNETRDRQDVKTSNFVLEDQGENETRGLPAVLSGRESHSHRSPAKPGSPGQRVFSILVTLVGFPFVHFVSFVVHALGKRS